MAFTVKNNNTESRFEAQVDDCLAFVDYQINGKQITLVHTEVPSQLGGQGVGGKIVKAALDFAVDNHLKVLPECPFVARYIERHPYYHNIRV